MFQAPVFAVHDSTNQSVQVPASSTPGKKTISVISILLFVFGVNCLVWGCIISLCQTVNVNDIPTAIPDEVKRAFGPGLIGFAVIFFLQLCFYAAVAFIPALTLNRKNQVYLYAGCILAISYFIPAQFMCSYFFTGILSSYATAFAVIFLPTSFFIGHIYIMGFSDPSSKFSALKPFIYKNEDYKYEMYHY